MKHRFNFTKYSKVEKETFEKMTPEKKYQYMLLTQIGNPYVWGKESPQYADCSGAVSLALIGAGWIIRTTAHDLLHKIFTERTNGIDAIFFLTKKESTHGGRIVPAGTATHVIGIVDEGVVLNMTPPEAKLETISSALNWANRNEYAVVIRGASREALDKYNGLSFYGADNELLDILDTI